MNTKERMEKLGWSGVVPAIMTIHDVPFSDNPEELIPTTSDLDDLRNGFDAWMEEQGKLL